MPSTVHKNTKKQKRLGTNKKKQTQSVYKYKLNSQVSKTKKSINIKSILYKNLKCNEISQLMNTLKVIKSLGEGSTGHSLKLCDDYNCEYPISVKFSKVSKTFTFNSKHPVKVEMKVQRIVNKLIENNITPHFNRTYGESIIHSNFKLKSNRLKRSKENTDSF